MATVDLSLLPPPDVVEALDFETIIADLKADLVLRYPAAASVIGLESEPIVKLLEVAAYRELTLRARINDAARAVMLAYATGADLDHIGVTYYDGELRLTVSPADPTTTPPTVAVMESDDDFRARLAIKPFSYSVAGPTNAYVYFAKSSSPQVADVAVDSPEPCQVRVTVLAEGGDGSAAPELLATVLDALSAETVRPLTDQVTVESASIIDYAIEAVLHCFPGPSSGLVLDAATAATNAYVVAQRRLGRDPTLSGLYAALHQPGVQRVDLIAPADSVAVGPREAAHCTAIDISLGDADV